jgi:putative sterol carrier protein
MLTLILTTEDNTLLAPDDHQMHIGRKMLHAFRLNTNVKQKLASQLSRIQNDPTLLATFQLSLASSQFQALAELMTGSGVHRFDRRDETGEEIIFWNNHLSDSVRQIFVAEDLNSLVVSSNGPLPKFAVLTIEDKRLSYHVGIQPGQGRFTVDGWFATLLNRLPGDQIDGIDSVLQFNIIGDNGCCMYLVIDQSDLTLHKGTHDQPVVTITAEFDEWLALINGNQTPKEMFLRDALQIGGNLEFISGLADAFQLSPPGQYMRDKWRLYVNYLDSLTLQLGEV